jgi:hypothetical protein
MNFQSTGCARSPDDEERGTSEEADLSTKASGQQLGIILLRSVVRNGSWAVWRVYMLDYEERDWKVATHFK